MNNQPNNIVLYTDASLYNSIESAISIPKLMRYLFGTLTLLRTTNQPLKVFTLGYYEKNVSKMKKSKAISKDISKEDFYKHILIPERTPAKISSNDLNLYING